MVLSEFPQNQDMVIVHKIENPETIFINIGLLTCHATFADPSQSTRFREMETIL